MTRLQSRCLSWYQKFRIAKFRFFSDCARIEGQPILRQPVQFIGKGTIRFNGEVILGYFPTAFFLNGYIYLEARSPTSIIQIEDGVSMNNNVAIVSDGPGIFIGKDTMLGTNCEIFDSDFHELHPDRRRNGIPKTGKVEIGENVMIGSNVSILRGVKIGKNAIIANGSVVTRSIPEDALAFGNPARAGFPMAQE
jgi:acetyltransferase-like isoleucine patch superfamily enzyme